MTHRWVDRARDFGAVIDELRAQPAIGLDTEFHRERTYHAQLALLQLAWGDPTAPTVALVDPLAVDIAPLAEILDGPATIVMHAGGQDLEILLRACDTLPRRLFDTQLAAGFAGHSSPSLASLVASILDVKLAKVDRLADWLARPVPEDQRVYAAGDVAHLLALHLRLREGLERDGRLAWAEDECADVLVRAARPRPPEEVWWRIKEARQLRGRAVAVVQTVAAWRERRAARVDVPARFVLSELGLVGIAQRPPPSVGALRKIRGVEERHLRGGVAEELLASIEEGVALPADQVRLPPASDVDRELRPAVTLASALVSQLGRDLRIDPALLATRADLESFLRDDPASRLAHGWRAGVVGSAVTRLVAGSAALAFEGGGRLVLEERSRRPLPPAVPGAFDQVH